MSPSVHKRWLRNAPIFGNVLALANTVIACAALYFLIFPISSQVSRVIQEVEDIGKKLDCTTAYPPNDAKVDLSEVVRGCTLHPVLNNYLAVSPVQTGQWYVQGGELSVDSTGAFTARAQFGTLNAGCGQAFIIQVISTSNELDPGVIEGGLPLDAVTSGATTVWRRC